MSRALSLNVLLTLVERVTRSLRFSLSRTCLRILDDFSFGIIAIIVCSLFSFGSVAADEEFGTNAEPNILPCELVDEIEGTPCGPNQPGVPQPVPSPSPSGGKNPGSTPIPTDPSGPGGGPGDPDGPIDPDDPDVPAQPSPTPFPEPTRMPTPILHPGPCEERKLKVEVFESDLVDPKIQRSLKRSYGGGNFYLNRDDETVRIRVSFPKDAQFESDLISAHIAPYWEFNHQAVRPIPPGTLYDEFGDKRNDTNNWMIVRNGSIPSCTQMESESKIWEPLRIPGVLSSLLKVEDFRVEGDRRVLDLIIPAQRIAVTAGRIPEHGDMSLLWDDDSIFTRFIDRNDDWYLASEDDIPVRKFRIAFSGAARYGSAQSKRCELSCSTTPTIAFVNSCHYTSDAELPEFNEIGEVVGTRVDENTPAIRGDVVPLVKPWEKRLWDVIRGVSECKQLTYSDVKKLQASGIGEFGMAHIERPNIHPLTYSFRYGDQIGVFVKLKDLDFSMLGMGKTHNSEPCLVSEGGDENFALFGTFSAHLLEPTPPSFDVPIGTPMYNEGEHGARIVEELAGSDWEQWLADVDLAFANTALYSWPLGAAVDRWQEGDYWESALEGITDLATFGAFCKYRSVRVASQCSAYGVGTIRVGQHLWNIVGKEGSIADAGAIGLTVLEFILAKRAAKDSHLPKSKAKRSYDLDTKTVQRSACGGASACKLACSKSCAKIAETTEEFDEAAELAYEVYRAEGYIAENSSRRFRQPAAMLNPSKTLIVSENACGKINAAATAISDGPAELPVERYFSEEVKKLRQAGKITEWGTFVNRSKIEDSLSCNHLSKKELTSLIEMMSHAFDWSIENGSRYVVIGSDEGHARLYKRLLGMEQLGPTKSYAALNNRPVVLLYADIQEWRNPDLIDEIVKEHPTIRKILEGAKCEIADH